jgi:hypothetical protein
MQGLLRDPHFLSLSLSLSLSLFGGSTHGLTLARLVLYHLSQTPSPTLFFFRLISLLLMVHQPVPVRPHLLSGRCYGF